MSQPAPAVPTAGPRRRPPWRLVAVVVLLLGVPALGVLAFWLTLGRSPFDGVLAHDFGEVRFAGPAATVEHRFELTNRSRDTIIILEAKPSCRCAVAALSSYMLDPGETLRVDASLKLSRSGFTREAIGLVTKAHGVRVLELSATGRRDPPLWTDRERVTVRPDEGVPLTFTVEIWGDGDAPRPAIETPPGVEARLDVWDLTRAPDGQQPAVWSGLLTLTWSGSALPADARLVLRSEDGAPLVLAVEGGDGA